MTCLFGHCPKPAVKWFRWQDDVVSLCKHHAYMVETNIDEAKRAGYSGWHVVELSPQQVQMIEALSK